MASKKRLINVWKLVIDLAKLERSGQYDHENVLAVIASQETVDAVEVVHGRCNWCNGDYHTKIMATAIRYHSSGDMDGYEMKVNYCPNCGAKMDGDGNG